MNPTPSDPTSEPAPTPSLASRLLNIIAAPGEVLDYLRTSRPAATNWLVPVLLFIVVSWIGATLLFSQDWVNQQILEVQQTAMEAQLAKQGKSAAEIEQVKEASAKYLSLVPRIAAYAAPPLMALGTCLLWGLIAWLVAAKACKAPVSFHKGVELVGITLVIDTLGAIVKPLLIFVTGNVMASASPAMLLKPFDPANPLHSALSQLDLFSLWGLALLALGLARVSGRSVAAGSAWVFGIWLGYRGALLLVGQLLQSLTAR